MLAMTTNDVALDLIFPEQKHFLEILMLVYHSCLINALKPASTRPHELGKSRPAQRPSKPAEVLSHRCEARVPDKT